MAAKIVMDDGGGPVVGSIEVLATTLVTLSNLNDTGVVAWKWTLRDKPDGSAAALSATNIASPTITPDIPGEYMIELITYRDAALTIFDGSDSQVVGIRYAPPFDWLIPAAGQTSQRDAVLGWKKEVNRFLIQIRNALLGGGGGITQLTGDVLAGPGVGSVPATVVDDSHNHTPGLTIPPYPVALPPNGLASNDLSGSYPGPTVARVQGQPWDSAAPAIGDVPSWDGVQWAFGPPAGANPVGPATCIFVDAVGGNDGTGMRGRADLPFLTIGAAMSAVTTADDCVVLGPGTHSVTATIPEPLVGSVSIVGYGRDVTRVLFNSSFSFLPFISCGITLIDRLTLCDFTIALATGDIGIVADGSLGNGDFMRSGGLELTRMRFVPFGSSSCQGWTLTAVCRLVIDDVQVEGSVSFDTCHAAPSLSQGANTLQNLSIYGGGLNGVYIKWDDDVAQAFAQPMTRSPMEFRECSLGNVLIDFQPDVRPFRCNYTGLTSANPLGNSLSGLAAVWYESDCVIGNPGSPASVDFTASQLILDVPLSPEFSFTRPHWNGFVVYAFERVSDVNGRTSPAISDLSGPGGFSLFQCNQGVDGRLFGANIMPTIGIGGNGTFTPGVWRPNIAFGPTVAGPNFFPFPWGPALAGNNWIIVQPDNSVPGEVITAGPGGAAGFNVDATIGGGFFYANIGWVNGY